jgi:beta-alanine degradation protein BauB
MTWSIIMKSVLMPAAIAVIAFTLGAAPAPAPSPAWGQNADHGSHHMPAAMQAPAPIQTGPAAVKIEFENESVLVLRIRMEPLEKTPMHDIVGSRVVVWLTDTHLRDTSADGRTNEIGRSAGAVDWVPAQRHAGENLGDQPIEWLAIVPKATAPAAPK